MKSSFYHPSNAWILYCRRYSFFVVDLLVDLMFVNVSSISDNNFNFVFWRQEFSQLHLYHESNHLGHGTVGNGRSEMNWDFSIIINKAALKIDNI